VTLKLIGTYQLLVYADHVLEDKIDKTIKKKTEILPDTSKEVGLEENAEKTKFMLLCCCCCNDDDDDYYYYLF
jgi:hypothetical protein